MRMLLSRYDGTPWKLNPLQVYSLKTMRFGTSILILIRSKRQRLSNSTKKSNNIHKNFQAYGTDDAIKS